MDEKIIELNKQISQLRKELEQTKQSNLNLIEKTLELKKKTDDTAEKNLVYVDVLTNTPHCKSHGAMLCMNEEGNIYRCPACNVGMLCTKFRGCKNG